MKNEPIENLFLIMSMKDDDKEQAEKAYNEFHSRYSKYLYGIIISVAIKFKNTYDYEELAENVFQNTLLTIWEKADTFMKIEDVASEKKERRVKAWLGKIARNEMFQLLRDYKTASEKITYDTELINEINLVDEPIVENQPKFEKKLLNNALKTLKPRDKDILLAYYQYYEKDKNMPSEALDNLCRMFDTTKDNLRQIKKRALDKVNSFIEEQLKICSYEQR